MKCLGLLRLFLGRGLEEVVFGEDCGGAGEGCPKTEGYSEDI
jgi:hypothetical protein